MLPRIVKFASAVALGLVLNEVAHSQIPLDFRFLEIYSTADGSAQFILLEVVQNPEWDGNYGPPPSGQPFLLGQTLTASDGRTEHAYTFANNPSNYIADCEGMFGGGCSSWAYILVATQGFADLNLVRPDFVVPNGFLFLPSGSLRVGISEARYEALPTDGEHARGDVGIRTPEPTGEIVPALAFNNAGEYSSLMPNYTGSWWAAPAGSESGWGINFAHQGDIIFATWLTYDAKGKPWWLVMTATRGPSNDYAGTLYEMRGPPFGSKPFNPALVKANTVGTAALTFTDIDSATFSYIVNGISQTKAITRERFGASVPTCIWGAEPPLTTLPANYTGMWWAAPAGSESGWGISLAHQGDAILGNWLTYDTDGVPSWLALVANRITSVAYDGKIFSTVGPPFNSMPFDPARVVGTTVGTATLFFTGSGAYFKYTVNGVSETKPITRQVFAPPGTVCQ